MVKTEIILIGTELLNGGARDETGSILAQKLVESGYWIQWISLVGDVQEDIEASLRQASGRASLIITTGGLGFEEDDVTRRAVSRVVGRRLTLNEKLLEQLEGRFKRQKDAGKAYARGALVPARSRPLVASAGRIHGFALHWNEAHLVCLPGNPEAAMRLFGDAVGPYLSERFRRRPAVAVRTLHTAGLKASEVRDRLKDLLSPREPIRIRIRPRPAGVDVEITSTGPSEQRARAPLGPIEEKLSERLGEAHFGSDRQTLEAVVAGLLSGAGRRIAIAESCTGGLLSHRLTNIPGSSKFLDRSCVCYSNESKTDLLGVSPEILRQHGAVSAQTAEAMARGILERSGADMGVSVTGIAGPTGGRPGKPVGLVFFALAWKGGVSVHMNRFRGHREAIKLKASEEALDRIRRHVLAPP